jgi:tellurite resistance protein TerC
MLASVAPWALFLVFVAGMLALDLGVFHKHAHVVSRREALLWSAVWMGLALLFNAGVYFVLGAEAGVEWTTGYLIEKSLSVDNVFIFLLIFATFAVPAQYQHRVLFWGIVGAVLTRGVLILVGAALLSAFHAVVYIFGAFLIITGLKFLRSTEDAPTLERNLLVRLATRLMPTTTSYEGQRFFVRRAGVLTMTPLFLVLLLIESTDVIFAVDSIPAIYAITGDPFIVFTSNIFAILGLRALYFVLSGYLAELRYLKPALAAVLVFVGGKMLLADVSTIPAPASLAVVVGILGIAIAASLLVQRRGHTHLPGEAPPEDAGGRGARAGSPPRAGVKDAH